MQLNGMNTSVEGMIIDGRRLFTNGYRTVGGEEEESNNQEKSK